MPRTAGSSTADQPRFYFSFADPASYLWAERVNDVLPEVPEWIPVALWEPPAFRCAEERKAFEEDAGRVARTLGLPPLVWPGEWPEADGLFALRAATYAKSIGRAVAFSLAAFRQAFAAGRRLDDPDTVLIAAAALELRPRALLRGAATEGTRRALAEATDRARAAGVRSTPALVTAAGEVLTDLPAPPRPDGGPAAR